MGENGGAEQEKTADIWLTVCIEAEEEWFVSRDLKNEAEYAFGVDTPNMDLVQ